MQLSNTSSVATIFQGQFHIFQKINRISNSTIIIPAAILILGENASFWNCSFLTRERIISPTTEIDKTSPNAFVDKMSGLIIITTHKSTNHPKSTIRNKFLFIVHISVFQIGLFMVFDIFYNNKNYYENANASTW